MRSARSAKHNATYFLRTLSSFPAQHVRIGAIVVGHLPKEGAYSTSLHLNIQSVICTVCYKTELTGSTFEKQRFA